ncbi:hypothetical protein F2P56_009390 [Juglans regia]|uniref:Uncharacterized protein n=2 Tax=Juglans regia TaxID=51240 RepID=A0A833XX16_JUGRE|nr:uncharacterized protein LOC109020790 [Juglans regia]KAF5472696.1 hypothetical protein F2P56_009390 [Juglans regia]
METLSRTILGLVEGGFLYGFSVGNGDYGSIDISHLLFANNTLIFYGGNLGHIQSLRALLCFEVVSDLRVNLSKSELVPVEVVPDEVNLLGCKVSSLPNKYLGSPLGNSFKFERIWNVVVENVGQILASWKRLYLSKRGRLTLIKYTLSNLPTYFLSLFPLPIKVANHIKKLQ